MAKSITRKDLWGPLSQFMGPCLLSEVLPFHDKLLLLPFLKNNKINTQINRSINQRHRIESPKNDSLHYNQPVFDNSKDHTMEEENSLQNGP